MNFAHFRDFNADRLPDYRRGLHGLRCGLHRLRRGLRELRELHYKKNIQNATQKWRYIKNAIGSF